MSLFIYLVRRGKGSTIATGNLLGLDGLHPVDDIKER